MTAPAPLPPFPQAPSPDPSWPKLGAPSQQLPLEGRDVGIWGFELIFNHQGGEVLPWEGHSWLQQRLPSGPGHSRERGARIPPASKIPKGREQKAPFVQGSHPAWRCLDLSNPEAEPGWEWGTGLFLIPSPEVLMGHPHPCGDRDPGMGPGLGSGLGSAVPTGQGRVPPGHEPRATSWFGGDPAHGAGSLLCPRTKPRPGMSPRLAFGDAQEVSPTTPLH